MNTGSRKKNGKAKKNYKQWGGKSKIAERPEQVVWGKKKRSIRPLNDTALYHKDREPRFRASEKGA